MDKWSDGYVNTNGIRIHYYRTGGEKPQVVFNHGAGDDGLCWTHVAKELEHDFDVIMPDARGHGRSASGKKDYSSSQRVADLAGLIRELKLDRPVTGGHSMGADTCMHLGAEYPDLTRGVFLEDPPIILPGEKFGGNGQKVKAKDIGKVMSKFMTFFKLMPRFIGIAMFKQASPTYPDDEVRPWINSKKRMSFDFAKSMSSMQLDLSAPFEVFKKINVPVLLFIGDNEKMAITSVQSAQKAIQANARVKVVHLEGASHDIRRTRFDGYMPALQKFLKDIFSS